MKNWIKRFMESRRVKRFKLFMERMKKEAALAKLADQHGFTFFVFDMYVYACHCDAMGCQKRFLAWYAFTEAAHEQDPAFEVGLFPLKRAGDYVGVYKIICTRNRARWNADLAWDDTGHAADFELVRVDHVPGLDLC